MVPCNASQKDKRLMKTTCRCEPKRKDGVCCRACKRLRYCPQACLVALDELPVEDCRGGKIYGKVE